MVVGPTKTFVMVVGPTMEGNGPTINGPTIKKTRGPTIKPFFFTVLMPTHRWRYHSLPNSLPALTPLPLSRSLSLSLPLSRSACSWTFSAY